jgi:3-methylfumaryl-CoA hydratase
MSADLESLKQWIGRTETAVDYVTVPMVDRLSATLDRDDPFPKAGDALPVGWHSTLFPRIVRHSQIGPDGHPQRGDFLPPVPLPRRMFAGKRTTFIAPLLVGDEVQRTSTIQNVTIKDGRSGRMVFVTVKTDIKSPRGLAISEEQDIVYRGEPDKNAPPAAPMPAPGKAIWTHQVTPDPVMLFRYSALTFNGHRIHYDKPYVTEVEGYPNLVMNGGLTTLLVYELARTHGTTPIKFMSSRNVRALFVGRTITLCGEPSADNKTAKLWAQDDSGAVALTAEAEFK